LQDERAGAHSMLLLLSLTYLLAYYDRLIMSVLGELVKREFALSDGSLALLSGAAFMLLYGACGIGAGWLIDRSSRKRILAWALALWSVFTIVCGVAGSFVQLAVARAAVGLGQSTNVPAAVSLLADRYPPERRPLALGIFYAGGMIGMLLCFVAGTAIAAQYGWRAAFIAGGPPGLIVAALMALNFREPPRERQAARPAGGAAAQLHRSSFRLILENRPLLWLLTANALGAFMNIGLIQWLPNFFMRSHHLSIKQVGLYFGPVLASGMLLGLLAGGWIGNRVAARSVIGLIWFSAGTMLSMIPLYLLIFWVPSLGAALAATFIGTTLSVLYAPSVTASWQTLCDARARGTAAGISSFANAILGGAGCSYIVGVLSDLWRPALGAESLRYALTAGLLFCLAAAGLFAYAARLITAAARGSPDAT
jgi:MFS family permease